jgi:hypothetical protein
MTWLETSELIRNYGLIVGGAIGLGLAWWRGWALSRQSKATADQAQIARRAHIVEVFHDAVGNLANEKLEIRLGAVFTLKKISEDFPDYDDPVVEVLSAYVRERSIEEEPPSDIREIMKIIHEKQTRG